MVRRQTSSLPRLARERCGRAAVPRRLVETRVECLEQILRAFRDIADYDDIHQAADRLTSVQEWIRYEAERAAADPIFVDLRLV